MKQTLLKKAKELGLHLGYNNKLEEFIDFSLGEVKKVCGYEATIKAGTPLAIALKDNFEAQKQFLEIMKDYKKSIISKLSEVDNIIN